MSQSDTPSLPDSARSQWVVLVSDGEGITEVYGPFDQGHAERVAADRNNFVQTLGFHTAKSISPLPKAQ